MSSYVPAGGSDFGLGRDSCSKGSRRGRKPGLRRLVEHSVAGELPHDEQPGGARARVRAHRRRGSRPVMMIDETMARKVFGAEDPIGRRIR